jgi:hypothetical protein
MFVIKSSQATSHVKWLNGEKNQRFEDHLRPRPQGTEVAGVPIRVSHFSTLRMRTEMVLETLFFRHSTT